jgi:hypothetical protein
MKVAKLMHRLIVLSAFAMAVALIAASTADAAVCTEQYAPVCGRIGSVIKTYPNKCFARADGARVIAEGPCRSDSGHKTPK